MIENGSFESLEGVGIRHWKLHGGDPESHVGTEDPHSGQRFAILGPTGSRLAWSSERVAVRSSTRYGLSWWMRIGGVRPWHWTYLTNFTGVELEFLSADGDPVGTDARRLRCLRTRDWQRAWVVFEVPEAASFLRVNFVLDSPAEIEMHMHVDDVELEEISQNPPRGLGRLSIRVDDGPSGSPFARFFVKTVEDESEPSAYPRYSYPFKAGLFYHVNDPTLNYLDLPPGRYRVRATRGPEFTEDEQRADVIEGEETRVTLKLERAFSAKEGGWYGGDHHVHLFFHGDSVHPQMTVGDVMKIAKGEGLNFVSFCGEWSEFAANLGNHEIARDGEFVGQVGLESVNDFYGHICTMGWTGIPPQSIPMRCVPWPMNTDTIESLTEMGGAWVNAHPFDRIIPGKIIENMGDTERLCNARELPIILALGHKTCFDILCHATPGGAELKTAEYYRLLNMGFRVGITASTDFYVDQARGTPGHNRTFVRAGELDFARIAEAYREGRTYATNGPLIEFTVEGCGVGDELEVNSGRKVSAELVAFSRMGLDRARVVINGKTYRTIDAKGQWIREKFEIPVKESSWVAVHVEGPVNDDVEPWDLRPDQRNLKTQFAHTSPVYITVAGRAMRPTRSDVDFLLAWIDAASRAFHGIDRIWKGHPDEPYLSSSFSDEDRARITAAFHERVERAKAALLGLLE